MENNNINEHTDGDIVDVLSQDFPKVFEQILEHLDNQEKWKQWK